MATQAAKSTGVTIIDRYMLRQFVQTFAICFVSLTGLYIIIDGAGNLAEFIDDGQKKGGVLQVMGQYYAFQSIGFFDKVGPLVTLISAMFTVTWIQRHNELPALEAAGIARGRVVLPVICVVVAISLLGAANREFVIPLPAVRNQLSHNAQDLGGRRGKPLRSRYDNETVVFMGGPGSKTFGDLKRIEHPQFHLPAGLSKHGARLTAENAFYEPPVDGRPGGYRFRDVHEPKGLEQKESLFVGDRPVLLTPRDNPWLAPNECFVSSNVTFEHLEAGNELWQYCSTPELIRGLRNPSLDFGTVERLAIHSRVVQPVLDVLLVFLGLPLVLARTNRNVFKAIGMCLALVVAFTMVVLGCRYLGSIYWIEPALAAWLPLMIFVPAAVAMSQPFRE